MKVTIESTFHNGLTETFVGLKEGENIRRLKYCCVECQCGWPIDQVRVIAPDGFRGSVEALPDGNIVIKVEAT